MTALRVGLDRRPLHVTAAPRWASQQRVGDDHDHGEDHYDRAPPLQGSARIGVEPHEAVSEFPKQPSRKVGLGTMCTEHWRAYVKGLRDARKAADSDEPAGAAEMDAA